MKTLEDAPFLDMLSPEYRADPGPIVDAAREESWLARTDLGGVVISRHHVQALLADRRLKSSLTEYLEFQGLTSGLLYNRMTHTLLAIEGPDHTRVRTLVRKAFVPAAVDRHRPLMRALLDALIDPVRGAGGCEFMSAVAEHYPIQVMCELMGVPARDHEQFTTWIKAIAWTLSMSLAAHRDEAEDGMQRLDDYVTELIAERRAASGSDRPGDLVTELVRAEEAGDRLSDDELRSLVIGLLFAGYDTTRNQLGLAVWAFAQHPEQWALLAERSELVPAAVEEVMRFRGAVAVAPRLVAEDFELDGYHLTAGSHLMLSTTAANHDPAAFADPHRLDITAVREPQLTFGGGPHYCLGASLARAELQEALVRLPVAFPDLTLDGEPVWRPPMGIFGPDTLPIAYRPAGPMQADGAPERPTSLR